MHLPIQRRDKGYLFRLQRDPYEGVARNCSCKLLVRTQAAPSHRAQVLFLAERVFSIPWSVHSIDLAFDLAFDLTFIAQLREMRSLIPISGLESLSLVHRTSLCPR